MGAASRMGVNKMFLSSCMTGLVKSAFKQQPRRAGQSRLKGPHHNMNLKAAAAADMPTHCQTKVEA